MLRAGVKRFGDCKAAKYKEYRNCLLPVMGEQSPRIHVWVEAAEQHDVVQHDPDCEQTTQHVQQAGTRLRHRDASNWRRKPNQGVLRQGWHRAQGSSPLPSASTSFAAHILSACTAIVCP